jgi:Na+/H+-dicarboxylate symporter
MSKIRLSELRLPLILVAEIILCLAFGDLVPTSLKTALYSLSVLLKNILVTALPFIIFSILFSSLGALKKGAFTFTALAFSLVIVSNYVSTSLGGFLGMQFLDHIEIAAYNSGTTQQLVPLWETLFTPEVLRNITQFWGIRILQSVSNDMALFVGISCGLLLAFTNHSKTKVASLKMKHVAFSFLQKGFIPLIPLFILGYILNMQHSGLLNSIFQDYLAIITLIVVSTFSYIVFLYGVASSFKVAAWRRYLKNMFPAMLTGFSTMSSASALPLVMEGAAKNTGNENIKGVVPI